MTSTTAPTGVATPRLERPAGGRMIAGVAAGLARHLNIEPVLVRLTFVVAVLAGGFGVLAYIAGLLLIPEEGADRPILHAASTKSAGTVAGVVLLVIGGLMAMDSVFDGHFFGHLFWTAGFLGAGLWLLLRSPGENAPVASTPPTTETHVAGPPPEPAPERRRGGTRVVAGLMLIAAGAVSAVAAAGVDVGWQEASGIAVIAAGAVLVAGSLFGASPWLVLPPLLAAGVIASMGAAGATFEGPIGERHFAPALAADLPERYQVAIGELEVDLRDTRFPAGTTELEVHVGIGEARVLLPDDVAVRIDGHAGAGEVTLPGGSSDGADVDRSETIAAPGRPTLVLDADVGLGDLNVVREGR
jgi:phage shock protein PspC (stress-responsive transcriptional regulator)